MLSSILISAIRNFRVWNGLVFNPSLFQALFVVDLNYKKSAIVILLAGMFDLITNMHFLLPQSNCISWEENLEISNKIL